MPAITFSGLASGIDADAIIKATLDARRLASDPFKETLEFNKEESKSLEELNTKLLGLNGLLKDFMTLAGSAISKSGISSNEAALGVSVTNAAPLSSTTVTVSQLAQSATFSFNDRFPAFNSPIAPGMSGTGTLDITVGTGTNQTSLQLSITNTTTLEELGTAINAQSNGKVHASVVNLGTENTPQYAFIINSVETGIEKGSLNVTVSPEVTGQGVFTASSLAQAQDSIFNISGVGDVTRSSNRITDLIPGVTLDLKQANAGPILVSVKDDRDKTAAKFGEIVQKLNDLITWQADQNKVERIEEKGRVKNVYSPLGKNQLDQQALVSIRTALSDARSQVPGSKVQVLADLGLTTNRDGTFSFDQEKFLKGLADDPTGSGSALNTLADKLAATNGIIDQYTKFQGIIDSAITANDTENDGINQRLERLEDSLAKQEEAMRRMFSQLESRVSDLQQGANALLSLASLPTAKK